MKLAKSNPEISVKAHCDAVAELAAEYGKELGIPDIMRFIGWMHDVGKYGDRFQDVLNGTAVNIDHAISSAAIAYAMTHGHELAICEAIAGHHGSLMDFTRLRLVFDRLLRDTPDPNVITPAGKTPSLNGLKEFQAAMLEFRHDNPDFRFTGPDRLHTDEVRWKNLLLYMLQVRLRLSCQVDADYSVSKFEQDGIEIQEHVLRNPDDCLAKLNQIRNGVIQDSKAVRSINVMREQVYQACSNAGHDTARKFCTLTAGTGSGKTFGMLKFALERMKADTSKRRVFIVLPYLSISDEISKLVLDIIPDAIVDNSVTEHTDEQKHMTARWDAACIITTTVQFFDSLFSDKPGNCRKLHRIANSVILFDEIQTLPDFIARYALQTLHFLNRYFNADILLSTATQPVFSLIPELNFRPTEIFQQPQAASNRKFRYDPQIRTVQDITDRMAVQGNACCIVNMRRHARELYQHISQFEPNDIYMLSADMCPAHRQDTLCRIHDAQASNKSVRVISTQCIEAGVNLDFEYMLRAIAPLSSLIQAAGRQNRNGRYPNGQFVIFEPKFDDHNNYPDPYYERGAMISKGMLLSGRDIFAPNGIQEYYTKFFSEFDEPEKLKQALFAKDYEAFMKSARLIKRSGKQVFVPYDLKLYEEILEKQTSQKLTWHDLTRIQKYCVQSYETEHVSRHCQELTIRNFRHSDEVPTGIYILLPGHHKCYDSHMGLTFMNETNMDLL